MKWLIDEDLSPVVARRLREGDGLDAVHVRERGLLGQPDHAILEHAFAEDRILITANVKDFQKLARAREIHPGIILVLDGQLSRDEQLVVVRRAVAAVDTELQDGRDMVNRVLEISDESLDFYDLPKPLNG
jgi:predicted nuclease of predicted toxin-antitoxin system